MNLFVYLNPRPSILIFQILECKPKVDVTRGPEKSLREQIVAFERTSRYYFSGLRVSRLGRDVSRSPVKSLEVLVLFPWDLECHAFSVMYREALSTIEKPRKITRSPFSYSLGVRVPTKGDVSRTPLTLFIPKPLLEFFAQQKEDQSEEQHQERTPKLSKFLPEDV